MSETDNISSHDTKLTVSKLSKLQKLILTTAYDIHLKNDQKTNPYLKTVDGTPIIYLRELRRGLHQRIKVHRASRCRAIRRLQDRGLIERCVYAQFNTGKSVGVILTEKGLTYGETDSC